VWKQPLVNRRDAEQVAENAIVDRELGFE